MRGKRIKSSSPENHELSLDAQKILKALPKDGSMVGNISLIRVLNMTADQFFNAKLELFNAKQVIKGRGKGGSPSLANPVDEVKPIEKSEVSDEYELYEHLKKFFDDYWKPDYEAPDLYISKITGPPKGHMRKSGLWQRPDISILTVQRYEFLPDRTIELTTIEAKRVNDINTRSVYETASQSRFGHQSYLAVEWTRGENIEDSTDEDVREVLKEVRRLGIGH